MQSNKEIMNVETLDVIAAGQSQRQVLDHSLMGYVSKMKVLTNIINKIPELRSVALELDENGVAKHHSGKAKKVFKLQLPITVDTSKRLFAAISIDKSLPKKRRIAVEELKEAENFEEQNEVEEVTSNPGRNLVTVSAQTYQNYKSALKWWHMFGSVDMDKVGCQWPSEVDEAINVAIAAYKRDIADKKRRGVMRQKEGKSPYNLNGYVSLCAYFNKMKPDRNRYSWMCGMFASLFTKLSVNTIGRSDNVDDLLMSNISWENDALTLCFGATKPDQAGETTAEIKRLYANPFLPEVCVIYGLAIYTWSKRRNPGDIFLFDGKDQNKRYFNILKQALKDIPIEVNLGCPRCDIGTHSNRKFAESSSASKIDGPSRTQVCLRAGQSVGRSQDCYMFSEEDGDSLVGRTLAQLKFDADQFDILACHFSNATLVKLNQYGWDNILDGYSNLPPKFQNTVPYQLASLVYHYHNGDMERLYPHLDHPIYAQKLFTNKNLLNELKEKVILVHSYCPDTHMNAQGVPGFIIISREIRNFRAIFDEKCREHEEGFASVRAHITNLCEQLPQKVVTAMLERIEIGGARPISIQDIRNIINELLTSEEGPISAIASSLQRLTDQQTRMVERMTSAASSATSGDGINSHMIDIGGGSIHYWIDSEGRRVDDKMHMVPFGFKWPNHVTGIMWNYWFFGDPNRKITAFKRIKPAIDLTSRDCKLKASRTKLVINKMISLAVAGRSADITGAGDINATNSSQVYDYAFRELIKILYPTGHERPEDINIQTLYNRMK